MTIKLLLTTALIGLMSIVNAQDSNLSAKFNTGMSFSKPGGDLGEVATKGKAMQLFSSAEIGYHLSFSEKSHFGIKVAGVAGTDYANFLANDRSTELKVSAPNLRARIYPLANNGPLEEELEKILPKGLPFLVEIPVWIAIYTCFNSLHFDYGVGFGKILETDYSDTGFQDETVNRTMRYFGWGFQPQIFQSESQKWTVNAVFDFGKYSWTNANKGTSSFKSNHVGFGVQYNF
jgi:hypothetical protein